MGYLIFYFQFFMYYTFQKCHFQISCEMNGEIFFFKINYLGIVFQHKGIEHEVTIFRDRSNHLQGDLLKKNIL